MCKNKRGISLPTAVELSSKGVKFATQEILMFNKIPFDGRTCTFQLPTIEMDDRTYAFIRKLLAFEALICKGRMKSLMCYVDLMECLINKAVDIEVLRNRGIIHNHFGTDEVVADVWNGMQKVLEEKGKYEPIDIAIDGVTTFYTN